MNAAAQCTLAFLDDTKLLNYSALIKKKIETGIGYSAFLYDCVAPFLLEIFN